MPHAAVNPQHRDRAKSLRHAMTRAETLLWRYLKAHHVETLGFRRQVPMKRYVADFVCHAARLVVELDGETHDFASSQNNDHVRDAWFRSQGYTVLRFTNDQVMANLEGVVAVIRTTASERDVPPSRSQPHQGGGHGQTAARRGAARVVTPLPNPPHQGGRGRAAARGKAAS
jgi:very-short-patch-repair endonuclease